MAESDTLTLAFLTAHPLEAARVLERLPGAETAALFERVPARTGARALTAMLPTVAAQVVGGLDDAIALALLTAAGTQGTVAVLRHIADPRRTRLIEALPTTTAVASRLLLGYPEDAVGAWVDPAVMTMAPAADAGTALQRLRSDEGIRGAHAYVVDAEQRLAGVVDLQVLLRAPAGAALGTLMRPVPAVLSAVAPVVNVSDHPGWEDAAEVPVVERGARFIGVLRRAALTHALARSMSVPAADEVTVMGLLARGYWVAVAGLAEAGLVLMPRVERVLPEER
jgi:magnesium transporter